MSELIPRLNKRVKVLFTEDSALNYAAYLLADENGISIKVAKYRGTNRVDPIENNEYGYSSLIKATRKCKSIILILLIPRFFLL